MAKARKTSSMVEELTDNTYSKNMQPKRTQKLNNPFSEAPKGSSRVRSQSSNEVFINSVVPPPPTHSRLPPDGHEFPQEFKDSSGTSKQVVKKALRTSEKKPSSTEIPHDKPLPLKAKASSANSRQDERSSRSVRDKIAMFGGRSKSVDHMLLATRSTGSLVDNSNNIWMRREQKGYLDKKQGERSRSMVEIARAPASSVQKTSDKGSKGLVQKPIVQSDNKILPLTAKTSVGSRKASRSMSFMIEERKRTFERLASQNGDQVEQNPKCRDEQVRQAQAKKSSMQAASLTVSPNVLPENKGESSSSNINNNINNSKQNIGIFKQSLLGEGGSLMDRYFPPPPPIRATTRPKTSYNSEWFDRKAVSSPESEISIQELMVNFEDSSTEGSLYSVSTASNSIADIIVPVKINRNVSIDPPSDFKIGEQVNNFRTTDGSDSSSSSNGNSNSNNNNGESTEWDSFDPAETKWDKRPMQRQIDQRFIRNSAQQQQNEVKAARNVQKPCRSVHDLRSAFEVFDSRNSNNNNVRNKSASTTNLNSRRHAATAAKNSHYHHRVPSVDSTTSDESALFSPTLSNSMSCLLSPPPSSSASSGPLANLKDRYGSVSSLASSTSLISPQATNLN